MGLNGAWKIALVYALFSLAWILVSDRLLLLFLADPHALTRWQTGKGLAFVLLSSLLVYALARRLEATLRGQAQAERRFQGLVEAIPAALWWLDAQGRLYASPGVEALTGYPAHLWTPAFFRDLVHPEDRPRVEDAFREGQEIRLEYRLRRADGGYVWVRDLARRVDHGLVGVMLDITAEKALLEAQKEQARAEAHARTRAEFLSRMSHELRTPLNAILGFAQLLEMEDLPESQRENVRYILKAGRHLLDLINEVLDLARLEAGRLPLSLEPVDLEGVLKETAELVAPLARERGVRLYPPAGCQGVYALADQQRLKQILLNLLANAVKYNRQEGEVYPFCAPEGEWVRIGVRDTGAGLTPEELSRLFRPFERLGREGEGAGLGLALSLQLAQAMGGRLWAESTPGQGTTFFLELAPAAPKEAPSPPPHPPVEAPLPTRPLTLLYVEDNLSNLRLLEKALARMPGVRLLVAMQGSLGLELAWAQKPDLILLDLQLPDLPGEEVLARLKADPKTAETPVVILTAEASPGTRERLLQKGALAFLTKPLDLRELYQLLAKVGGEDA
ncbi:hypothetical protein FJNA_11850 [Thermus sp. FJN-A]